MLTVPRIFYLESAWMMPCLISCLRCSLRSLAELSPTESPPVTGDISRPFPLWLRSSTRTGTLEPLAPLPPSPSPLLLRTVPTSDLTAPLKLRGSPPGGRLLPTRSGGRCLPPPLTIKLGQLSWLLACLARRPTPLVWPTWLADWLAQIALLLSTPW